jgi:PKD repeat protein
MLIRRPTATMLTIAMLAMGVAIAAVPATPALAVGETAQLPTADPANNTPNVVNGEVDSIWQVGNTMIIGGTFTQIQNATSNGGVTYTRSKIAAFDATTGAILTGFNPTVDGDVTTVIPAPDSTSVFIGGSFDNVNGVAHPRVARISLATGALINTFDAGNFINGTEVRDMRLVGSDLLIGGRFTSIRGQARTSLASLSPDTGALTPKLNVAVTGQWNGGTTNVSKMEVTPAGDKLMVIGNFTSVGGQTRNQIAMLDLTTPAATVNGWYTDRYEATCSGSFDTYMRDLDISEDGTYAVITTTGAYRDGLACDTDSRFEIGNTSGTNQPTWTNYTGGDTSYAVEIHNGVAYIGGHMRWANNPNAGDAAGSGAVPRPGMMALDVRSGLPFSWNPTRDRGVGLFDFHVTAAGLWAGSDTDHWNNELRKKLAFFPWAGGSMVPANTIGGLPSNVVLLGQTSGTIGTDPSVLFRVNAGGPTLTSVDDGPDWIADSGSTSPYRNAGSNVTTSTLTVGTLDTAAPNAVPTGDFDRPPAQLFTTERWDPDTGDEMQWHIPIAAGTPITVRLYLGNKSGGTADAGQRIFDIDVEGNNAVNDLDLSSRPGHNVGTMRAVNITSDGTVDILFRHMVENPLINGIEIIRRTGGTVGTLGTQDQVRTVTSFDGTTPPADPPAVAGTAPWHTVRGAFMVNGTLFTLHADGTMVRRSFNGTSYGAGTSTFTYANSILSEVPTMTGIFYDPDTSRIYYTLSGQNSLYSRSFLPESRVIGANRSTVSGAVSSLAPTRVRGMFLSGGQIWFADNNTGALSTIGFSNGAVTGTDALVESSIDWRARAMFLVNPTGAPNVPPTAAFTQECVDGTCSFDSSGSDDADGTLSDFAWDFGDGLTDSGSAPEHIYLTSGNYTVTLTVTDSDSAAATVQHVVTVIVPGTPPPPPIGGGTTGHVSLASPARVLDTRPDGSTVDLQYAAVGVRPRGSTLVLPIAGRAGVPADAKSVVLNVTVTEAIGPGFITVYPCDAERPTASNLNYVAGQSSPNLVVAKLAADGSVCLFNSEETQLIVDVAGYFPGLDAFTPLPAPARLLDTRDDGVTTDGVSRGEGIRGAGTTQVLQVAGRAGVPLGASSAVLNVTVDRPETAGFITVYPCDAALPTASNVNYVAGQTIPNAAIAKLAADGTVCLYTSATTHIITDIAGYFADASVVVPLPAPARLMDTRSDGVTIDGTFQGTGLRPTGGTVQLAVGGRAGVPATASAVVLNVTVDQPQAPGFITVYPADGGRPNASNLNYVTGQTVPNAVIARLGPGGAVCLFDSGATHLIVDVAGYITGPAPAAAGLACPPDQ